jgi:hypothetical protein
LAADHFKWRRKSPPYNYPLIDALRQQPNEEITPALNAPLDRIFTSATVGMEAAFLELCVPSS